MTQRGEDDAAEVRYRMLFEGVGDSILAVDPQARIVEANPAAERLLGRTRGELVSRRLHELVHAAPAEVDRLLRSELEAGVWRGELELRRRDGGVVPVEARVALLSGPWLHVWTMRELLERRRMDESLSGAVARAREAERAEIARELHDEIGQVLTGLGLALSTLSRASAEELPGRIAEAEAEVTSLARRVRRRSLELRPTALQKWGLRPALTWYVARYEGLTGIRVELDAEPPQELDRRQSLAAYRIVQEALTNVARHAGTRTARVAVQARPTHLWIEVQDEGRGFDAQSELAFPTSAGLGGMRERAEELGGEVTVEAAPGRGTRIIARLPLVLPPAPVRTRGP